MTTGERGPSEPLAPEFQFIVDLTAIELMADLEVGMTSNRDFYAALGVSVPPGQTRSSIDANVTT